MNLVIYILGICVFMGKDENCLYCVILYFLSKRKKIVVCLVYYLKCVNFSLNIRFLYDFVSFYFGECVNVNELNSKEYYVIILIVNLDVFSCL